MKSKTKQIIILGVLFLIVLNTFAFYILKEGIGIAKAIKNTDNKEALNALEQKQIWTDVLPSLVFTIDIAIVLLLLYLVVKMVFKSLKKSTSTK